jgi:hypothetical protein
MKISEILRENDEGSTQPNPRSKLSDVATIKTNFPDADFWIRRKGREDTVGTVCKEFDPECIGVKVTATDILDPKYLSYVIQYLQMRGYFKLAAKGTLRLKNITVSDVARIPLSMR